MYNETRDLVKYTVMAMNKQKWKLIKGFILIPIILSFVFALALSVSVFFTDSEHNKLALFFVGIIGWFIHAIPFATIIIIFVGVPAYLLLSKSGCKELRQYLMSGVMVGALLPLAAIFYFGSIEWWVYFTSAIFGLTASYIFWQISIKP